MTVISLRVSVPVLSLQITVVQPRVSTAASLRTTARRRAMRCTPTASAMVIATGRPSGTMPTTWLMATSAIVAKGSPCTTPMRLTTTNITAAAAMMYRPNWAMRRSRGVCGCSGASASRAICPISVSCPVATTTARARPEVTCVPA